MTKKTILFLLNRECTYLPPFMTILDSLCEVYSLKVISYEKKGGIERLEELYKGKDVEFLCRLTQDESTSLRSRLGRKINKFLGCKTAFHKKAIQIIKDTRYDLLWVIHENTLFEFRDELDAIPYLVNIYELNDRRPDFLKKIEPAVQSAKAVVVPEYNRACILRVWLHLQKTPYVVPNKTYNHPQKRNIENKYSSELKGKKVILYQGYIQRNRNLDKLCQACGDLNGYKVVLMGKGDNGYINELLHKYPNILLISFIEPPQHLYITSWAYIAIVKYDYVLLNTIFCAPNKTWEYTGFGIPVLGNDIPGLEYTIGASKAGICTDMDSVEEIRKAIKEIEVNYDFYSSKAKEYFNSFDVKKELEKIVKKYC